MLQEKQDEKETGEAGRKRGKSERIMCSRCCQQTLEQG